ISGTPTTGDVLTITAHNSLLPSGVKAVSYTVLSTDTIQTISAGLAAAINADSNLQAVGVAVNNAGTLAWSESFVGNTLLPTGASAVGVSAVDGSSNAKTNPYQLAVLGHVQTSNTTYSQSGTAPATTMTLAADQNGIENAQIGGTPTTGDVLTITVHDSALSGGQKAINYTVAAGDNLPLISIGLTNAINADASLQAIGVSAVAVSFVSTAAISSNSVNSTSYTKSLSAGAT